MKIKKQSIVLVSLLYISSLSLFGLYLSSIMLEKSKSADFIIPIDGAFDALNKNSINLELSINNIISYLVNSEYVAPAEFRGITDAVLFQHPQIKAIGHVTLPIEIRLKDIDNPDHFQWNQDYQDEKINKKEITLKLQKLLDSPPIQALSKFSSDFVRIADEKDESYAIVFNKIDEKNSYIFFVLNVEEFIDETLDQSISDDHTIYYDEKNEIKSFESRSGKQLTGEFKTGELLFYNRSWPIEIYRDKNNSEYFFYSIPFITFLIGILLAYFSVLLAKNKELSEYRNQALVNLKFAQQKIIEAQKLNAMGGLVAGVAHEINTPLGICITSSSHALDLVKELQRSFSGGSLDAEMLNDFIESSVELIELSLSNLSRASKLISSFKEIDVSNISDASTPELANIENIVLKFIENGKIEFDKNHILFKTDFLCESNCTTLPAVLNNILLHLTRNVIAHAKKEDESCLVSISIYLKEGKKYLRFSDNGIGSNNINRIVEPFFTTKRGNGHAGLGLSVVYNLVQSKLKTDLNFGRNSEQGLWFEFELINLDERVSNE